MMLQMASQLYVSKMELQGVTCNEYDRISCNPTVFNPWNSKD